MTVEGLNLKYTVEGRTKTFPGMCRPVEMPLDVTTDVALVDPTDELPADFEWQYTEEGERVRVSARTGIFLLTYVFAHNSGNPSWLLLKLPVYFI